MNNSFNKTREEVLQFFKVDPKTGLTVKQVEENEKKYGKNELPKEEGTPFWKLVLSQFEDQLVRILLLAAIISFVLALFEPDHEEKITSFVEALVIVLILIANATVGLFKRRRQRKQSKLSKLTNQKMRWCYDLERFKPSKRVIWCRAISLMFVLETESQPI